MRAAVFSDVHGNLHALQAVLAAAEKAAVDESWVLGDLAAHGPHPAQTVRRLRDLAETATMLVVRGNTDRYVVCGQVSPFLTSLDPALTPDKARMVADSHAAFAWTREAVESVGCLEWLGALPSQTRVRLPAGARVLLVHAAPGTDDGPGLFPEMTDQQLLDAGVTEAGAELIFVGHTHVPMDRTVDGVRVVNLGSVSVPRTPDQRAQWTLLVADAAGYTLEQRAEDYDVEAVLAALHAERHPSAAWLESKIRRP